MWCTVTAQNRSTKILRTYQVRRRVSLQVLIKLTNPSMKSRACVCVNMFTLLHIYACVCVCWRMFMHVCVIVYACKCLYVRMYACVAVRMQCVRGGCMCVNTVCT